MGAALLIAAKDLRQRLRDRSAFLLALVMPLVLATIFGVVLHDAVGGSVSFVYGLVDEDRGAAARTFETEALRPLERRGLVTLRHEASIADARGALDRNELTAVFVVPAGFTGALAAGRPAELRVLGNRDAQIGTAVALSIAQSYVARVDAARVARAALGEAPRGRWAPPVAIDDVSTSSRQLDAGTYYAAGMAVFFLFFTVQFGITSLLAERREGTLARILAAPVRRNSLLVGKLLTSFVLGIVSMAVLALATHFLLGADWGDPVAVAILIVTGVLAATAVMAVVATFARTPDQAQASQTIVALVLGMLGGSFFPVAQVGGLLATLSLATPQAWFLRGIGNLTGGAGPEAVVGPAAAMLVFAAVTASVAVVRVGRLAAP